MAENVQVCVRVRPTSSDVITDGICVSVTDDKNQIILRTEDGNAATMMKYTFDFVADIDTSQQEMFERVGRPIAASIFEGINGTIFAYGQTGSGKTFTIIGPDGRHAHPKFQGIAPRVLRHVFDEIALKQLENFKCTCSFLEIYNETIHDLISGRQKLGLREDRSGVYVANLTETPVSSAAECLSLLAQGLKNRSVSATAANRSSSRSHSVLTLCLEFLTADGKGGFRQRRAKLNLVDLAGSERQSKARTSGIQLKEACAINQSLHHLGQVINTIAQSKKSRQHVNYRDSKLTFMLRDSLGGSSRTFLIATVSPNISNFGESMSTLQFATRAKEVKNVVTVNENTSQEAELQRILEDNRQLQLQLQLTLDRVEELEQLQIAQEEAKAALVQANVTGAAVSIEVSSSSRAASIEALRTPERGSMLMTMRSPQMMRSPQPMRIGTPSDSEKLRSIIQVVERDLLNSKRERDLMTQIESMTAYIAQLENQNGILQQRLANQSEVLNPERESSEDDPQIASSADSSQEARYELHSRKQLLDEIQLLHEQLEFPCQVTKLEQEKAALMERVREDDQDDRYDDLVDQVEQLRVLNRELLRQVRGLTAESKDPNQFFCSPRKSAAKKSNGDNNQDGKLEMAQDEICRLQKICADQRTELSCFKEGEMERERQLESLRELIQVMQRSDFEELKAHYEAEMQLKINEQKDRFESCARALLDAQNECIAIKSINFKLKGQFKKKVFELESDIQRLRAVLKNQIHEDESKNQDENDAFPSMSIV